MEEEPWTPAEVLHYLTTLHECAGADRAGLAARLDPAQTARLLRTVRGMVGTRPAEVLRMPPRRDPDPSSAPLRAAVLEALRPGPKTAKQLVAALRWGKGSVRSTLTKMVAAGAIRKVSVRGDFRKYNLWCLPEHEHAAAEKGYHPPARLGGAGGDRAERGDNVQPPVEVPDLPGEVPGEGDRGLEARRAV